MNFEISVGPSADANTCIGKTCRQDSHPETLAVVTNDSATLTAKTCNRKEAPSLAGNDYGGLFHKPFIGDRKAIKENPSKINTSYGKRCVTMAEISSSRPKTHSNQALRDYLVRWFSYLRTKKGTTSDSASPPTFPEPPNTNNRFAVSNMLHTNRVEIHLLAFDTWKRRPARNSRAGITDITKAFPDQESIDTAFRYAPQDTVVIGVDPGEVVAASFCALDPRETNVIKNLLVKRSALYTPVLAFRSHLQMLKSASGINTIENGLKRHNSDSVVEVKSGVTQLYTALEQLNGFYGSKRLKKMTGKKKQVVSRRERLGHFWGL